MRLVFLVGFLAAGVWHLMGAPAGKSDTATIVDSGSTNRPGFRIEVDRGGTAELTQTRRKSGGGERQPEPTRRVLPHGLIETFYADLKAAQPFASLPGVRCAKSVSFGSALTVEFGGEQTPDLNCGDGGNILMRDLIRDTRQITALFEGN